MYSYDQSKFVPPAGKTLLIVGQTLEDINDYAASFPNEPVPGRWATGWGIPASPFGHLYGLDPRPDGNAVFDFAKAHKKPMMVAESSPSLGIFEGDLDSWDMWFVNYFSLVYERNIKAISFVNTDFTRYLFLVVVGWQDSRLQNNETVAKAWFMETAKDRYLKQSPQLFEQLGISPQCVAA